MKTNNLFILLILALLAGCGAKDAVTVPLYVWQSWEDNTTETSLRNDFERWKAYGTVGVCFNARLDSAKVAAAARIAKESGLEYHAWIPTMLQEGLDSACYTVNRLGESAYDKPVYVSYYKTLDPLNPQVRRFLKEQFGRIASIKEVDYIQLDYIRYADVILARGLWEKYGLTMNEEYPKADYCYCDSCVAAFQRASGIDIRQVADPSACREWAQFRCDAITGLVNELADVVHAKGKKVSADVFPGPQSHAVWMVRQEWDKWNVDAYFPMNYNDFYLEPAEWIGRVTAEEVKSVAHKKTPVYSGLFICRDWRNKANLVDPEHSGLLPSEMEEAVAVSMRAGAAGLCLFTPNDMTPEHWKALGKAIRKTYR